MEITKTSESEKEEIAYNKGHIAHYYGYGLKYNPYKRFTSEWSQWKEGWNDDNLDDPYWRNLKKIKRKAKYKAIKALEK